ncbi:MAG: hypothetical protein QNJ41_11980 [Xenococcaceae cyanobacterium MO_188.B32]|nr:hypothetical protein [Xenococcaceae cyanobacterium MO_188.B32]
MKKLNTENGFEEYLVSENELYAEIEEYISLLPAWFTRRMLTDSWNFGLLLITGDILAIENIDSIEQDASGNLWLDATLQEELGYKDNIFGHTILLAPTSRVSVSINSSHVVAAFELADT